MVWLQLHPKLIASDYITTERPLGRTKAAHSCVTPQGAWSGISEAWFPNPSSLTYFNRNGRVRGLEKTSWYERSPYGWPYRFNSGFPIPVKQRLYIEPGPWAWNDREWLTLYVPIFLRKLVCIFALLKYHRYLTFYPLEEKDSFIIWVRALSSGRLVCLVLLWVDSQTRW